MRYVYAATVVQVVDGDTLDLDIDLGLRVHTKARVRLLGVNAPEKSTPEGVEAKYALTKLVEGQRLRVVTQKDKTEKFGRWLGIIHLEPAEGDSVNELMVKLGHAVTYDGGKR